MTKKPRGFIRIISRLYLPEPGAACLRLSGVANGCVESGSEVEVMTTTIPKQLEETEISVPYRLRRAPVLRNKDGYMRGYLQYLSFDIPLFFRLLFSKRPALTLVEPPPTTGAVTRIAYKILGIPYVYYAPDLWSAASLAFAPKIVCYALRLLESFALRGAVKVITINEQLAKRCREMGAKSVEVIPNGIDTSLFSDQGKQVSAQELERAGIGQNPFFIYTGIASQWQGATIFVDAFRKVREHCPDLHLVFFGQGTDWPALQEAADSSDLCNHLHIMGMRSPSEVAVWLRSAQASLVSLVAGSGYEFAYPTKTLSALSSGIPVIYAGPGPAAKDIHEHQLGWVSDYQVDDLAQTLINAYQATKDGLSAQQRQHYRRWVVNNRSLAANGKRIANLFRSLIKQ